MPKRIQYQKKATSVVIAVQLDLDTEGFVYQKWGGEQRCKPGDWLVSNEGECYTIDRESFAATYSEVSPGVYRKTQPVWAELAEKAGVITTVEGSTAYEAGDYLVCNNEDGTDAYAVARQVFEQDYELSSD